VKHEFLLVKLKVCKNGIFLFFGYKHDFKKLIGIFEWFLAISKQIEILYIALLGVLQAP